MPKKKKEKNLNERSFDDQINEFDQMIISIHESTNVKKVDDKTFIKMNANFIYLIALFERLIGHIIIYAIEKDKSVKKNYLNMFISLCDDKMESMKRGKDSWRKYYNKPSKMIKDYPILEREKKGIVILKEVLKNHLNFSHELTDKYFKSFNEARARRNLIAHRGRKPDSIYFEDLKKGKLKKKDRDEIFKLIYNKSTRLGDREEEEKTGSSIVKSNHSENPIDLSVTPNYLRHICRTLIYLKESFLMDLKEGSNLHDFIAYGVDKKADDLFMLCESIFKRKIDLYEKLSEFRLDKKVNYILLRDYSINRKLIKKDKNYIKIVLKIIDDIDENKDNNFPSEDVKIIKLLLKSHIEKDRKEFFKLSKEYLELDDFNIYHFNKWLIFKKYKKYKEFKELYEIYLNRFVDKIKSINKENQ